MTGSCLQRDGSPSTVSHFFLWACDVIGGNIAILIIGTLLHFVPNDEEASVERSDVRTPLVFIDTDTNTHTRADVPHSTQRAFLASVFLRENWKHIW